MNTNILRKVGIVLLVLVVMALSSAWLMSLQTVQGSAPSGLPASMHIATTTIVGPDGDVDGNNATTIFSARNSCSSRVITTNEPILLSFGTPVNPEDMSSTTIAEQVGITQKASTTVAYDSGIYGCGRVTGYALSSTTLTVLEFN